MRMHAALLLLALAACGGDDAEDGDGRSGDDPSNDQTPDDGADSEPVWSVRDVAGVPDLDDDDQNGTVDFAQAPFAANDDLSTLTIAAAGDVELAVDAAADVRVYVAGVLVLGGEAGTAATVPSTGELVLQIAFRDYRSAVRLTVTTVDAQDTVTLQAAPLILNHHLQPAEHVWAVRVNGNASMIAALSSALGPAFSVIAGGTYGGDVWIQDEIELGTVTGDEGQRLDVVVDSIRNRGLDTFPERELVGPGTIVGTWGNPQQRTTFDSFGNLEVSPPVAGHPFGRVYYGLTGGTVGLDEELRAFLGSQSVQAPFSIPTSWLCVGHVDELSSFVPDPSSPKGFKLVIADVGAAWTLLEGLDRDAPLSRYAEDHGYPTVGSILDDAELVALNNATQAEHVDGILATFKSELGLTDADVIRVPSLWERTTNCSSSGRVLALIPGMVNLLVAQVEGTTHVFTADPFFRAAGAAQSADPVIADFERRMPDGLTFHYLDDWNTYHLARGEVHCGTNVRRTPVGGWWPARPAVPWLVAGSEDVGEDLATMAPARTRDGRLRFTSPRIHEPGALATLLARFDARTDDVDVRVALVEAIGRAGNPTRPGREPSGETVMAGLAARFAGESADVRAMIAFVASKSRTAAGRALVETAQRDPDARVRAEVPHP